MPCSPCELTHRVMDGLASQWVRHSQVYPGGVEQSCDPGLGKHQGHKVKNMGLRTDSHRFKKDLCLLEASDLGPVIFSEG